MGWMECTFVDCARGTPSDLFYLWKWQGAFFVEDKVLTSGVQYWCLNNPLLVEEVGNLSFFSPGLEGPEGFTTNRHQNVVAVASFSGKGKMLVCESFLKQLRYSKRFTSKHENCENLLRLEDDFC